MRVTAVSSHGPIQFESKDGRPTGTQPVAFQKHPIIRFDTAEFEQAKGIDCHCHWPEEVDILDIGYTYANPLGYEPPITRRKKNG